MKNSTTLSSFTSLSLKIMGVVLVLSSLLDYIILAIPLRWQEQEWQIRYVSQVVDRGIVPMVGIAFILLGYWIGGNIQNAKLAKKSGLDIRLPIFFLASLLGLMFLLLVPLHLNNLRGASFTQLETVNESATEAETRIQDQYDRINDLLQNPERINQIDNQIAQISQALSQGQFQGQPINPQQRQALESRIQQLQNIRSLANNPDNLQGRLDQLQTQLRSRQLTTQQQIQTNTLKQGIKTGLTSLMLAIGYIVIGWFGIKEMTSVPAQKKA